MTIRNIIALTTATAAALFLVGILAHGAGAETCNTTCNTYGNTTNCRTTCY